MQTTLGELVSELVDSYERKFEDPELAAVATSVTLDELFKSKAARRVRNRADETMPMRKRDVDNLR